MILKVKKIHPNAVIPERSHSTDTGLDIFAVSKRVTELYVEYDTGIAVELSQDWWNPEADIQIRARSSVSDRGMWLANGIGTIDESYRGSLKVRFYYLNKDLLYNVGDKIAQLVVGIVAYPKVEVVEELSGTPRSNGGFGSTDA